MAIFGKSHEREKRGVPVSEQPQESGPEFERDLEAGIETNAYTDEKRAEDTLEKIAAVDALKPDSASPGSLVRGGADAVPPLPTLKAMHDELNAYLSGNKNIEVSDANGAYEVQQKALDFEEKEEGLDKVL